VSFKPNEPITLTFFHIRITKQKSKKKSNGRIGQHQVKDLIDKLKGWPTKKIKKKEK